MSETTIVALVAAVLGAIPPTLVSLANFRRSRTLVSDVAVIHTLVNSNLTTIKQELAEAKEEIAALREQLLPLKEEHP